MDEQTIRQQLARLKGEAQLPTSAQQNDFVADSNLDNAYHKSVAAAEANDWPAEDRETWEKRYKEWLQWWNNRVQPANEPETPFVVGRVADHWYGRDAIPPPRWPEPGAPISKAVQDAYDREANLYDKANRALQDCIHWTRTRLYEPDFWNRTECNGSIQALHAQSWAFLSGIWQARGLQAPSEGQMQQWAEEYNNKYEHRRSRSNTENVREENAAPNQENNATRTT